VGQNVNILSGPHDGGMTWDQYFASRGLPGLDIDGMRLPVRNPHQLVTVIRQAAHGRIGDIDLLTFWGVNIAAFFGPPVAWVRPWGNYPAVDQLLRNNLSLLLRHGAYIHFVDCNLGAAASSLKEYLEQYVFAGRGIDVYIHSGFMARARANPSPVHTGILRAAAPPARRGSP
jgi:hypothetical protein